MLRTIVGTILTVAVCLIGDLSANERPILPPGEARVLELLERRIDASFDSAPLDAVAKALGETAGIDVRVDSQALADAGIDANPISSGEFQGVRLRGVLNALLRQHDLTYDVEALEGKSALVITTPEAANTRLHTVIVPVADLLAPGNLAPGFETDPDSLVELMFHCVAEERWGDLGPGSAAFVGDALVVRHTWRNVEKGLQFIELLRKVRAISEAAGLEAAPVTSLSVDDADNAAACAALNQVIEVDMPTAPLTTVLQTLQEKPGIRIRIDAKALDEAGRKPDDEAAILLSRGSLDSVLYHILKPLELTWMVRDNSVVITTPETAEEEQETRFYPVGDLVLKEGPYGDLMPDFDSLMELVTSCVRPETWSEGNNPDTFGIFGTLAVVQTQETHRIIERLIIAYRQMKQAHARGGDDSLAAIFAESAADSAVRAALLQRAEFQFEAALLSEAMRSLSEKYGVPILLDNEELPYVGVNERTRVTATSDAANLGAALRKILEPLHLSYVIEHGAVTITSRRHGDHAIVIYPAYDLTPNEPEPFAEWQYSPPPGSLRQLIDAIEKTANPDQWDMVGGPGSLEGVDNPPALVVSQTEEVHANVAALLAQLRSLPPAKPADDPVGQGGLPVDRSSALPVRETQILAVLDQRIDASFDSAPLSDVAKALSEKAGIEVRVDKRALNDVGVDANPLVSGEFQGVRLRGVLEALLRQHDLWYDVETRGVKSALVITTPEAAEERLHTAVMPVADLLAQGALPDGLEADRNSLAEAIVSTVYPETWSEVGGPGELTFLGDAMVVRHDWTILEEVDRFLTLLRKAKSMAETAGREAPPVISLGFDDAEMAVANAALSKVIEVDFGAGPLDKAVKVLSEKAGIRITIDKNDLEDAGLRIDEPVEVPRSPATLGSILRQMLRPILMTWIVSDESILITTPRGCPTEETRIYPVADLVVSEDGSIDYDSLTEAIGISVAPEVWFASGPVPCERIFGSLVFSVDPEAHRIIERILVALREAKQARAKGAAESLAPVFAESRDDAVVRAALAKPAEFRFMAAPLSAVTRTLSEKHGIPVLLDDRGFDERENPADKPLTASIDGENLGGALHKALEPLELTYVVKDGALFITTQERAEESLVNAVYPIDDLTLGEEGLRDLYEVIEKVPDRKAWVPEGGPGDVQAIHNPLALLVTHTEAVHAEVAALLAQLRSSPVATPKPAPLAKEAEDKVAQRVFRLVLNAEGKPLAPADDLAKLIRKLVEPQSWDEAGVLLEPAHVALVVRHRSSVLRQVQRLLGEIGVLDTWPVGSWRRQGTGKGGISGGFE